MIKIIVYGVGVIAWLGLAIFLAYFISGSFDNFIYSGLKALHGQ